MFTPWGAPNTTNRLERGITYVRSASHGGLMLSRGYAESHLSAAARDLGVRFGEYFTYEMGAAWSLVAWELPHLREPIARAMKIDMQPDALKYLENILQQIF